MTLTTPYSATFIVGDGETKTFSYLFEEVSPNFISVMVYNSVTGLISTPTYVIDTDQKQVIFGEDTPAPTADETVCIYRNTPNVQDVAFRTLHGYDAQTLENILSKIVAMIQEIKSNYFSTQVLQGDPWQLDLLSSADDGATVNIDYTAKKLVKGLYFRITSGNLQVSADGTNYITLPKSDDVAEFRQYEQTLPDLTVIRKLQYRVGNQWFDAEANAQGKADSAYSLAESVQTTVNAHINNTQNPHQTSMNNLTDTEITNLSTGQFLMFSGGKWKNVSSSSTVSWGAIIGDINSQTDLVNTFVKKTGDTMSGDLVFQYSMSYPALHIMQSAQNTSILRFFKFGSSAGQSISFDLSQAAIHPLVTGIGHLGTNAIHFGDAHIDKVYTGFINNGYDIAVPVTNSADTLALKSEVDLAANSGRMITGQGVWYAKMYAATVAPSAENGTNYADFSQVDGQGNPIIVIYERQNGAWVQSETITPPAEYDGYVPITSKIWDIVEQAGQQGGRILWNHQSKEFTPYPQIISFEDIEITGTSTVVMPQNPGTNQIVNKNYVDEAIAAIPTTDIAQSIDAEIVGTLTVADNGDVSGFSSSNYLEYPGDIDMTNASTFEIVMVVTRWADSGGYFISERPDSILTDKHLTFMITGLTNPVLRFDVNDGSNYQSLTGTTILANNIKYYAKIAYDGTNYTLSLSTDGINYTTEATAVAQYLPGKTTYPYVIGRASTAWHYVHMAECYIKKDGILVWQGMDSPGLHQRVVKGHEVIAFQPPTANNNYTWYRKYADGWVEQGGITTSGSIVQSVTLPVTMADTNYTISLVATSNAGSGLNNVGIVGYENVSTTGFDTRGNTVNGQSQSSTATGVRRWEVKGMYAQ